MICPECRKELARGSLVTHRQTQHGMAKAEGYKEAGGYKPRNYRMEFPAKSGPRPCPFKGCSVQVSTWTAMKVHFWNRHTRDTVVILEEEPPPTQGELCVICWCHGGHGIGYSVVMYNG